jgi:site-specific recombinase XerD
MAYLIDGASTPNTVNSSVARTREYLTGKEVEKLMEVARKSSRHGHRDATMILIAYRHGLRASEVCDLQWHQVEINSGRLMSAELSAERRAFIPSRVTKCEPCVVFSASSRPVRMCLLQSVAGRLRRRAFIR